MAAVGLISLSHDVSCAHKYPIPCATRNMPVWTLQFVHSAEWAGQPLPPAQSRAPTVTPLSQPAGSSLVQPPLGSELTPLAFSPYWFVRAVCVNTTKIFFPLMHEASKPQNGGGWNRPLEVTAPVPLLWEGHPEQSAQGCVQSAVELSPKTETPQPLWATCASNWPSWW